MVYIPNNPQTNLSIIEFYQRLGWKYKKWAHLLPEHKKIVLNGEILPKQTIPNAAMQGIRSEWDSTKESFPAFTPVESLLAKEVLEKLTYQPIELHIGEGSWVIGKRPNFINGIFWNWIDDPLFKTYVSQWWKDKYATLNTDMYSTWLVDDIFTYVYPQILRINSHNRLNKRTMQHIVDGEVTQTNTWEWEPEVYVFARKLEEGQISHVEYAVYKLQEGSWNLLYTKILDEWCDWYAACNFHQAKNQVDGYSPNLPIYEKRINAIMDIDEVVSAQ